MPQEGLAPIARFVGRRTRLGTVSAAIAGVLLSALQAVAAETPALSTPLPSEPAVVLELFTSQGCSSCPPADTLLQRLSDREGVLALSLPVDYWDYLGWKDTLASGANSTRQRAYAEQRGDRSIYTPQMVINGGEHVVGSNAVAIDEAIMRAEPFTSQVETSVTDMAMEVHVSGALPDRARMATVYFSMLDDRVDVAINRGENSGETVTYVNVARQMQPIGMWDGSAQVFRIPLSEIRNTGLARGAVIVQLETEDGPGRIIGARTIDLAAAR